VTITSRTCGQHEGSLDRGDAHLLYKFAILCAENRVSAGRSASQSPHQPVPISWLSRTSMETNACSLRPFGCAPAPASKEEDHNKTRWGAGG